MITDWEVEQGHDTDGAVCYHASRTKDGKREHIGLFDNPSRAQEFVDALNSGEVGVVTRSG